MGADDDVDLMFEDTKKELIESIAENKGDQGKKPSTLSWLPNTWSVSETTPPISRSGWTFSITGIHKDSQV